MPSIDEIRAIGIRTISEGVDKERSDINVIVERALERQQTWLDATFIRSRQIRQRSTRCSPFSEGQLMKNRFEAHEPWLPKALLLKYSAAIRRMKAPEDRIAPKALKNFAAAESLIGIRAAAGDDPAEILLYDEIGFWGTNASDFAQALLEAGDGPITLRINSPGGDVFDGYAIYNMLRARTAPVSVVVDGLAASAASFIAMAGKTVSMGEPSMLMIHNSWGLCIGDRNDMLDMAATQEKIDGQIAAIYASKSGKAVPDMAAAMDAETWYTSTEAKAAGLCDVVLTAPESARDSAAVSVRSQRRDAGVRDSSTADAATALADANAALDAAREADAAVTRAAAEAAAEKEIAASQQRARLNRLRLAEAEAA